MNKTTTIIIGIVLIIAAFYGGMKYDQSKTVSAQSARTGQFAGRTGFNGGRAGGGFVAGQIVSKDANSITIQLMATSSTAGTGSAIVFLSASTTVSKISTVPTSSLTTGTNVTVTGSKNSDGSINANMIQIR